MSSSARISCIVDVVLSPHIVVGKRMRRAQSAWVSAAPSAPVRPAANPRALVIFKLIAEPGTIVHFVTKPLDQLGVVGGVEIRRAWRRLSAADRGGRLAAFGLPTRLSRETVSTIDAATDSLQRAADGNGRNRGAGFFGGSKNFADPFVGNAGPGGVVDGDKIDLRLHLLQAPFGSNRPARRRLRPRRSPRWPHWRRTWT